MRRLLLGLVLLPLVAACGGGGASKTTTASPPPAPSSDPGRTAMNALFAAAASGDEKAIWNLLSRPSRQRLGGYEAFKSQAAAVIEKALAPFDRHPAAPFVSQDVSQQFGVVAIRSGAKALAFPLRREAGGWKIETPGPLTFKVIAPTPGSSGSVDQIAVEVHSAGVVDDAVIWVDGKLVRPTLAPSRGTATVFAGLARPLPKGTHFVVVYAEEGNDAGAEAWSFRESG